MPDQSNHPALRPGKDEVKFFINGREVVGKKGETIITVAAREGVYVPHYCWHPALSVAGNCRLCLVEIHTPNPKDPTAKPLPAPKPVIGCQTPISPGMHVYTESALTKDCQNGMMEFLLANHPLDCPVCDRGGECMLQRYSMDYGHGHARMVDKKRKFLKPSADPLIDIERNRCIMCTRCVRFNDEVAGDHVMGVFDRGEGNYIGTFGQGPISNIFSGNVIDICPVGCLTSKPFRFKARVWELLQTQSTSIWDASGAKVTHWTRNGKLYRTTPPSRKYHGTYTVNEDTEEFIDNVTRFGSDFSFHEDRWDESRVRVGSTLLPGAYSEALKQAAVGLAKAKLNHGPDALAVVVSPRATMEEGFLAGKFARNVIGTENVDWRLNVSAPDAVHTAITHADGDLEGGFDAVVLINGDFVHTTPTFASRVKEHARIFGRPIIQIGHYHDPYFAQHSKLRFHCAPGETAGALASLAKAVKGDAQAGNLLAKTFNVNAERIEALVAVMKAEHGRALILQNLQDMGGNYLADEVPAAIALKQSLGAAWRYLPVITDRNAFGLPLVGAEPTNKGEGFAAGKLVEQIESGRIRAVLAIGADPLANYPDQPRMLRALDSLEFFVVSDLFASEVTKRAHVFIAAASHLEKSGTYCDVEGNLARINDADPPRGGSRADWETIAGIATLIGSDKFAYKATEEVFREMIKTLAPDFQGSFKGLLLPGPRNDFSIADPGGARNRTPQYNPGDYRVDGAHFRSAGNEVEFAAKTPRAPRSVPAGQYLLAWGRHVQGADYHLDRASIANLLQIPPYVEVNPVDAEKLGAEHLDGGVLTVGEQSYAVEIRVKAGPAPGVIYMPLLAGRVLARYADAPIVSLEVVDSPATTEAAAH
ncbi:molybdopterin-dependent oxidoreductase [Candidatus Sumerlaeota bacterium]|nr:molybdopterin-dependent oxidoreductase [Candidatus Sumerlaeota bacterium]